MNDLVQINNDRVVVSSRGIAEHFEKQHKHVLESIERLKAEKSALTSMFYETSYTAGTGKAYKEYLITKDGFSLLVMGFTGKKALDWKLKYINAFNEMEVKLSSSKTERKITTDTAKERRAAAMLMNARVKTAKLFIQLSQSDTMTDDFKRVLESYATNTLAGKAILPLPEVKEGEKTYSAGDIGKMLGISASKVGRLANAHGLKNPQYGKFFVDKAKSANKQVHTFRYYITALIPLRKALRDDFHKRLDSELDLEFGEE